MRWTNGMLLLLLAGCSAAPAGPRPREVRAEVDACDYCHMRVDDARMAAQLVEAGGRVRMFDEPGCLLAWMEAHPGAAAAGAAFVADAATGAWVPAAEALWVHPGARTEMGFDLAAFAGRAAAEARARTTGGAVLEWDAVRRKGVADAHAH